MEHRIDHTNGHLNAGDSCDVICSRLWQLNWINWLCFMCVWRNKVKCVCLYAIYRTNTCPCGASVLAYSFKCQFMRRFVYLFILAIVRLSADGKSHGNWPSIERSDECNSILKTIKNANRTLSIEALHFVHTISLSTIRMHLKVRVERRPFAFRVKRVKFKWFLCLVCNGIYRKIDKSRSIFD